MIHCKILCYKYNSLICLCFCCFISGTQNPHVRDEGDHSESSAASCAAEDGDTVSYTDAGIGLQIKGEILWCADCMCRHVDLRVKLQTAVKPSQVLKMANTHIYRNPYEMWLSYEEINDQNCESLLRRVGSFVVTVTLSPSFSSDWC